MNIGFYSYYKVHNNNRMLSVPFVEDGGGDTNYPVVMLAKKLRDSGHTVSTIDTGDIHGYDKVVFFEFPQKGGIFGGDKYFRQLVRSGFTDMYLVCMEPPSVKPSNWVTANHRYFRKIFTWDDSYIDGKKYIELHSTSHKQADVLRFDYGLKQKLCTAVIRNKFSSHPAELYSKRREIISWFEENHPEDFDLYGVGWDRCLGAGILRPFNILDGCFRRLGKYSLALLGANNLFYKLARTSNLVFFVKTRRHLEHPSYRGTVPLARQVLEKYKFAICFENSIASGWITERIFDCFLAGSVPVYLGDPNITSRIPKNTFVDMRDFSSYEDLYAYMKSMTKERYIDYINAISVFLSGPGNYRFSAEYFVDTLYNQILSQ